MKFIASILAILSVTFTLAAAQGSWHDDGLYAREAEGSWYGDDLYAREAEDFLEPRDLLARQLTRDAPHNQAIVARSIEVLQAFLPRDADDEILVKRKMVKILGRCYDKVNGVTVQIRCP